jgi:hypothetical protein
MEIGVLERPSMSRNTYTLMVNRGRKAGLSTREICRALATQPVDGDEQPGQIDGNGLVSTVTPEGHRAYRPATERYPKG